VLNLLAQSSAAVRAPADGTASTLDRTAGLARLVIEHGNGWSTSLSGIAAADVAVGDRVRRGEVIGTLAGGPGAALEFAVALEGRTLDPARYLLGSGGRAPAAYGG
jgi:murein DD-endopeptidase MepM/ murein hydrolase activator NlpD